MTDVIIQPVDENKSLVLLFTDKDVAIAYEKYLTEAYPKYLAILDDSLRSKYTLTWKFDEIHKKITLDLPKSITFHLDDLDDAFLTFTQKGEVNPHEWAECMVLFEGVVGEGEVGGHHAQLLKLNRYWEHSHLINKLHAKQESSGMYVKEVRRMNTTLAIQYNSNLALQFGTPPTLP